MALTLWVWWEFSIIKCSQPKSSGPEAQDAADCEPTSRLQNAYTNRWVMTTLSSLYTVTVKTPLNVAKMQKKIQNYVNKKIKKTLPKVFLIKGFKTDCMKPKQPRLGRLQSSNAAVTAETPQTQADGQIH